MDTQEEVDEPLLDPAAELGVLAGIVKYGLDTYYDVDDLLTEKSFAIDINQFIYRCIKKCMEENESVDQPSIYSAANSLGILHILERPGERKHIRAIFNYPIQAASVRKLAAKIRKLEIARLYRQACVVSAEQLNGLTGDEPISHIMGLVENPIFDLSTLVLGQDEGPKHIAEGLDEYLEYRLNNPVETIGISSGFPKYDSCIGGGLRRKAISLIGARTKNGKSMFADNVALHVSVKLDIPVLLLDSEMNNEEHWCRILANLSECTIDEIETGQISSNKHKTRVLLQAKEELKAAPFFYKSINGMEPEDVISYMRTWLKKIVGVDENGKTKDALIIYDYLKLNSHDKLSDSLREYQLMGFIITALYNFMVKYDVACLAFVQLNRDGISKEGTEAISQSDRIAQICSNFSILKRKSEEEIAEDGKDGGNGKLVPIIARHGRGMSDDSYIALHLNLERGRIKEGLTRKELFKKNNLGDQGFEMVDSANSSTGTAEEILF